MKIAVLLYGHLRDFDKCADSLRKHLLSKYDCDVFIHTWDMTDHTTISWHRQRFQPRLVDNEVKQSVLSLYSPKKIIIEHQEPYGDEQTIGPNEFRNWSFSTASCFYLFYTMNRANELRKEYEKESGVCYDYIIVTRPDVQLKKDFEIEKILYQVEMLGLDINISRFFATHTTDSEQANAFVINSPNDLFFMGVPDCIDRYISANRQLTNEFIVSHSPNIVSVYTAKEMEFGIQPIPLAYSLGKDWSFSNFRVQQSIDYKPWGTFERFFGKTIVFLCRPVFKLYQSRPWMNYLNR